MLLGPNLQKFTWDFSVYDQHSEGWTDFGQPQEDWLREFSREAAARNSTLRIIKIIFNPEIVSAPTTPEEYRDLGFPWGRMKRVKHAMAQRGMDLQYEQQYEQQYTEADMEEWLKDWEGGREEPFYDWHDRRVWAKREHITSAEDEEESGGTEHSHSDSGDSEYSR